jgi:hypothetical protein
MIGSKRFLLDANVFIEAKRRYYAFDICPGFWDCLPAYHKVGRVLSIDRVKQELVRGEDDLKKWVISVMPDSCFASTNESSVIDKYGEMQNWAQKQIQFTEAAKAEFANNADSWLVAYAKIKNFVLVTHEEYEPDIKKKIKLPNVCKAFGVDYDDTFKMLRDLNVRFSWVPPK